MILDYPRGFPPDAIERELPSPGTARAALAGNDAALDAMIEARRRDFAPLATTADAGEALLDRTETAVRLAYARLAMRHGRLGTDFHAYHNEDHILEICAGRIPRVHAAARPSDLSIEDACALLLFGAGHDLRQREEPFFATGIGANERASTEEMLRILDVSGFDREREADLYVALELMIAGSTFDARAPGTAYNAAELVQSGGALAAKLDVKLDKHHPGWRMEPAVLRGHRLALIAADLDTANVAEPFAAFAENGENLCREREMLSGRSLDAAESAQPALKFLTQGQDRFFFELHRFNSDLGHAAFDAGKDANAPLVKALIVGVRARLALAGPPATGRQVVDTYRAVVADLVG